MWPREWNFPEEEYDANPEQATNPNSIASIDLTPEASITAAMENFWTVPRTMANTAMGFYHLEQGLPSDSLNALNLNYSPSDPNDRWWMANTETTARASPAHIYEGYASEPHWPQSSEELDTDSDNRDSDTNSISSFGFSNLDYNQWSSEICMLLFSGVQISLELTFTYRQLWIRA